MAKTNFNRLLTEVATLDSDLQNPAASGVYANPDRTLAGIMAGVSFYDDVERDTHAYAVLQKRKMAVISYPWNVTPGDSTPAAKDAADLARRVLDSIGLDQLSLDLLDALLKGYSVVELMYRMRNQEIVIGSAIPRAAYRFQFDKNLELRLRTAKNIHPGEPVPPRKFLVHTHGGKDGNPYGVGLGSKLLALVRIKREVLRRAAEYAERVANGTVIATVDGGGQPELDEALSIAQTVVSSGVVATTKTTGIQLVEPSGSAFNVFDQLIKLLNSEISKCVLGETGSTEASGPGQASLAATHNGVRLELVRADADALSIALNRMLRWLTELNFGPEVAPPQVYRQVGDNEAFLDKVKKDHLVAALGFVPSLDYVRENYGGHWEAAPTNQKTPPSIAGIIG